MTDRSSARSKRRHLLQQLSRRCLLLAHLRKVRGSLRRHRHLLGEFRPGGEFLKPRIHVWVQLGERIAGKRQPVGIDEPGDIENRQLVAEQVRLRRQALVERVEFGAEGLCRPAAVGIGEAVFVGAFPKLDLRSLLGILDALHGT